MDVANLSVEELKKLEKQVRDAIQVRFDQQKEDLKRQIRELARRAGTTIEELFGSVRGGAKTRAKVAAKYADPSDANKTWSGRGRMPGWMQSRVDGGARKEDFLIK